MVETAAHMVDNVLPRVPYRQWVLSMPKRVRWHLRETPEVISGLLGVFLRAVETTIRQNSPDAPPGARFGAVAFVHRFGSYLNSHVHFHVIVTDGVFSAAGDGTAVYYPALELDQDDYLSVQTKIRHRGLRWLQRHGHLDSAAVHALDAPDHVGGWSVDASVNVLSTFRRKILVRLRAKTAAEIVTCAELILIEINSSLCLPGWYFNPVIGILIWRVKHPGFGLGAFLLIERVLTHVGEPTGYPLADSRSDNL